MAAGPPSLLAGLDDQAIGGDLAGRLQLGASLGLGRDAEVAQAGQDGLLELFVGVLVFELLDGVGEALGRAGVDARVLQEADSGGAGSAEQIAGADPDAAGREADRGLHAPLDRVAHQALVDAAELLLLERAVAEPLAVEEEEAAEHSQDHAVADAGHAGLGAVLGAGRSGAAGHPALQERVALGVEELAAMRRHAQRLDAPPVLDAEVERTKEHEQAGPGAEALVHRVAVDVGVSDQGIVKTADAQVVGVDRMLDRQEPTVLGIEGEDQPQHDGEQALVDMVAGLAHGLAQDLVAVAKASGLEALEQDLQGLERLLAEPVGDVGLALAAELEQLQGRGRVGHGPEHAVGMQQLAQGAEHVAAGRAGHVRDVKADPAGGLAGRTGEQAQGLAVGEQAHRHSGLAQEPFELGRGRVVPLGRLALGGVERQPERELPDQHLIGLAGARGRGLLARAERGRGDVIVAVRDREGRAQLGALFVEAQDQIVGQALALVQLVGLPAAQAEQELADAGEPAFAFECRVGLIMRVMRVMPVMPGLGLGQEALELAGLRGVEPLHHARVAQDRDREGQALARLALADPSLVELSDDVGGHGQRVSGIK